ncbi:MAG: ABC transporter ATP-binding protein [Actinomycetota bacterium]|nr:ABC transporter ATP-binding protein [Actinomycetota bacterium]
MTTDLRQPGPLRGPQVSAGRICVVGLSMGYAIPDGCVLALDDVALTVEPGRSLAVVGPSGCGKSTLLGILGGLEVPTAGEVRVGEHVISSMPDQARAALRRRAFGFVFQQDNLQPFLTVSENVGLQSIIAGIADESLHRKSLLDALDMGSLSHRFPDQLSGGQRQRVAVARALVHSPVVVLADEPTGALDAASSDKVVKLLLRLHKEQGATLVVVTHDRSVAERMDAVVEMRDGRVSRTDVLGT